MYDIRLWKPKNMFLQRLRSLASFSVTYAYVSEKLAKDLNLCLSPLTVVTFGTEKSRFLEYKHSTLQLILKDGKAMCLDVSVVPIALRAK